MTPSGESEEASLHALILVLGSQPAPQCPAPCKDLSLRNLHPHPIQGQMRPTGAEHMLPARKKRILQIVASAATLLCLSGQHKIFEACRGPNNRRC